MNPGLSSAVLTLDTYERTAIPDYFIGTSSGTVSVVRGTLVWWCRLDYEPDLALAGLPSCLDLIHISSNRSVAM